MNKIICLFYLFSHIKNITYTHTHTRTKKKKKKIIQNGFFDGVGNKIKGENVHMHNILHKKHQCNLQALGQLQKPPTPGIKT